VAVPGARARLTGRAAVLFLVAGLLVVAYAWPVRAYWRERATLAQLHAADAAAAASTAALQAQVTRWEDPAFVQAQARARLHYVLPGEVGYTILLPAAPSAAAPAGQPARAVPTGPGAPWYDQVWTTVARAAAPAPVRRR